MRDWAGGLDALESNSSVTKTALGKYFACLYDGGGSPYGSINLSLVAPPVSCKKQEYLNKINQTNTIMFDSRVKFNFCNQNYEMKLLKVFVLIA